MSSSSPPPTSTSTSISSSPTNTPSSPSSPTITSANYFFGFIVTFVVLLLLFVGCGVGSRRRFAFVGTVWDEGLLDMDEGAPGGRETGRRRRRLVRPVFWDMWVYPERDVGGKASQEGNWEGVQPISASFIRPPLQPASGEQSKSGLPSLGTSSSQMSATNPQPHARLHRLRTALNSYPFRRRRSRTDHPPKPPPPERPPPPEAVQIAVMICMPSSSTLMRGKGNSEGPSTSRSAGEQTSVPGEYQIGITQLPWTSGDI